MKTIQMLTLEEANLIADGAEEKALELGIKIAISIMDQHGNLKLYRRMDGNSFISVRMSQLKAMTSSSMPLSTKALAQRNASLENHPYLAVPGLVLLEGGLPIISKEGQHLGAIGISGATSEMDGLCALHGLEKIKEKLKI
jgi:uncharacterized protein GlcG (DUF336 family)